MGIKKRRIFADLESIEKVAKKHMQKKLSTKKWPKNGVFDFYYCVQKFSAYITFLGEIFCIFLKIPSRHQILQCMIPISKYSTKNVVFSLTLFAAFKVKLGWNGSELVKVDSNEKRGG